MGFSTSSGTNVDRVAQAKVIGLTGGMGSGKSVVAGMLRTMGHPVYDADAAAKRLYDEDPALLGAVVDRFGAAILGGGERLDRKALAAVVFRDATALADLNALVHPAVALAFQRWRSHQSELGFCWVFREAAILFESGANRDCEQVWGVSAPLPLRVERIEKRSGLSKAEIGLRMERQWPPEQVLAQCDRELRNDGQIPLVPQVQRLVSELDS